MYGCLIASDPVISKALVAILAGIAPVLAVILPIKNPPGIALPGAIELLACSDKLEAPSDETIKAKYQAPGEMFCAADVANDRQEYAFAIVIAALALLAKDKVLPFRE